MMLNKKIELLAPAGDFETLKVAINAGADAIYCAGKMYGARAYATNLSSEELIQAIDYCHLYGVKLFVTVNTIIFENEIESVIKYLDFLYLHNCDGVIVQDLGLASIIKVRYPNMLLHASTQINAQTLEDVKFLQKIGFNRVILGREVSIDTLKKIRDNVNIELEVFIHGALCMSYSGACYFSSLLGGRSGNRGRCAQPCRKEYTFNGKKRFFLSPKDLCTIDNIQEISKYADSLKIEGRMKSKEYVYSVISSYKDVINNGYNDINSKKYIMQMNFNRGYTKGFINNEVNNEFTNILSSNHQGVYIGEVVASIKDKISIKLTNELRMNDSIRVTGNNYDDAITVNAMYVGKNLVKTAKASEIVNLKTHKEMHIGDRVFITKRPYDFDDPKFNTKKIELTGLCKINQENKVEVMFTDGENVVVKTIMFEKSDKDMSNRIREQLTKTGTTIYIFTKFDCNISNVFIPISEINELRRNLLFELNNKRINKNRRIINDIYPILEVKEVNTTFPVTSVAITNMGQLNYFPQFSCCDIYLKNKEEINNNVYYYLPRVTDEVVNTKTVFTNLGNFGKISSVYCNVCNSYTVRLFASLGCEKIGLSIEMSVDDIRSLTTAYRYRYGNIPHLEVMVYGYYQMMYMKHCFINKELGYKKLGCQECKKDLLLDGIYPVYGDSNCHLAILSKDVVDLRSKIEELRSIGIKHFLYDLTKVNDINNENTESGYFGHYIKEIE